VIASLTIFRRRLRLQIWVVAIVFTTEEHYQWSPCGRYCAADRGG
jgi:hypothetical protein